MAETLAVEIRPSRGKHAARRLRRTGHIPAVLYGHGQETIWLSVPARDLDAAVRHGSRVVKLSGGVAEQVFVRELQWDPWGLHILHADFSRISADETVEVQILVELRGEAPGLREGGVVEQLLHQLELECKATDIPEKLIVNINHLRLGDSITLAQLELPPGGRCQLDPQTVLVHCIKPIEVSEEAEAAAAGEVEPEVIGARKEENEEEEK